MEEGGVVEPDPENISCAQRSYTKAQFATAPGPPFGVRREKQLTANLEDKISG
jgi:hypothetical protein